MNTLEGTISDIITEEGIALVKVRVGDDILSAFVIEDPSLDPYLKTGNPVRLLFKETEVIIARMAPLQISVQNKLSCTILSIKRGKVLCELTLGFGDNLIRSIITRNACEQLSLAEKDKIIALIKTNEVSLQAND